MNNPHSGSKFKSKTIVPVLIFSIAVVLAGGVGVFWWPFGIAILFIGLLIVGLGLLGKQAVDEIEDT